MKNSTSRIGIRPQDPAFGPEAVGELYLFHPSDAACPPDGSLWGLVDRSEDGTVLLESSSLDLCSFRLHHPLPHDYRHHRAATRAELRDYIWNLAWAECCHRFGLSGSAGLRIE